MNRRGGRSELVGEVTSMVNRASLSMMVSANELAFFIAKV